MSASLKILECIPARAINANDMKLPDNPPRIRTGQIWRRTSNDILYLVTGGARSRNGQRAHHCRRYCQRVRVSHAITEKDLWRFYVLEGNWQTVPEYTPWEDIVEMRKKGLL